MCSDMEQDVRSMSFDGEGDLRVDLIAFLCVFLHACVRVYYLHGHKYVGA